MTTTTRPVLAWHGDPALRARKVEEMHEHRAQDEIIQGNWFIHGKTTTGEEIARWVRRRWSR